MKLSNGYFKMEINGERIYVKTDSVDKLREADAVIFDCDGVLIDIRESCNRAISETVTYIIEELTEYKFPENMVSKEVIHLFKKSGGFNNDWDLTYAILMCILCKLPQDFQEVFEKYVNINRSEKDLFKRFLSINEGVRKEYNSDSLDSIVGTLGDALKQFAKISDVSGIARIEKELTNLPSSQRSFYRFYIAVKWFLSYPGSVGESLLTTVFEEIFCGPSLFREIYKQEPRIYKKQGLIENERVIIHPKTLDQLTFMLGKANFGIASGRPLQLARHTLNGLLERFNPKALVFLEDVEAAEREATRNEGLEAPLKKPNPFSLFKSSEGLKPFKFALYVGDSMEDAAVVKEANKVDSRFLFVGVYGYSDFKNDVLDDFFKAEAEAILPSVNDLPTVLESLKRGRGVL